MKNSLNLFAKNILNRSLNKEKEILDERSSSNIDIYQNNYLKGHLSHLRNVYSACYKVLGENNFNFFMSTFLSEFPPQSENLNDYGKRVSHFLQQRSELSELPYLEHLAKLEWVIFEEVEHEVMLPKGIHELWRAISDDRETNEIEIDENKLEKIFFE